MKYDIQWFLSTYPKNDYKKSPNCNLRGNNLKNIFTNGYEECRSGNDVLKINGR